MQRIRFALLAAAITSLLGLPVTQAQEKKDPAKEKEKPKVEKVVVVDPAKVGPEYHIQGEYEGVVKLNSGEKKVAAQVVALGKGEYDVYLLFGGLPGAGYDGKNRTRISGKTENGMVVLSGSGFKGEIGDGKLKVKDDMKIDTVMTKVERKSPTLGKKPPEGAIVLFDGTSADEWTNGKVIELSDGKVLSNGINSKKKFLSYTGHLEFRLPFMPNDRGQGRSNSGFYVRSHYEIQILDSFGLEGKNNECAGIYSRVPPKVNMCLPPLVWQTYDWDYTAARFDSEGRKTIDATITLLHNGVKVHDNLSLTRPTDVDKIVDSPKPDDIHLQSHGNLVYFRNIWVVEKK